jgi:hypothetical protein
MTEPNNHQRELRAAFREVVLALGGAVALRRIDEEAAGAIARAIGSVVDRRLRHGAGRSGDVESRPLLRPHPAIAELLARIGRDDVAPAKPAGERIATPSEWLRLPGLFRRFELSELIEPGDELLVEQAGAAEDGTDLFAIYCRPHAGKEGMP